MCEGASPTLKNLTVTGNPFGIAAYSGSNPHIINCILWGNSNGDLFDCEARFSCLQQSAADKNKGNIRTDPRFADPERGDYHLKSRYGRYEAQSDRWVTDTVNSPCIDAGDPEEYPRSEPMPNGARLNGGIRVMSAPSKRICPSSGKNTPLIRLNRVVFPEPLGPTIPTNWPVSISRLTPLTATSPPKRLVSCSVSSTISEHRHSLVHQSRSRHCRLLEQGFNGWDAARTQACGLPSPVDTQCCPCHPCTG